MIPENVIAPTPDLADLLEVPLCNLGKFDPRLEGILCPEEEVGAEKIGITEQFLGDATTYHSRYSNSAHFSQLFEQAFAAADIVAWPDATILDIGTGSGTNTILPCLKLFAGCHIVATDMSPDLLRILRHYVVHEHLEDRVVCICTDAMNNFFKPARFDVVVGAAILHHLLDPVRAMEAAYRALKPGGVALFFEPFEGLAVLRVAFDLILERAAREVLPLDPAASKLLAALSFDLATRAGSDKSAPHFRNMDDKWLFTRDWLERASRKAGFSSVIIVPHASHSTLFRDYTISLLRLGADLDEASLPDWAWDMIGLFDQGFSSEMKRDLLLEGTIVLRKGLTRMESHIPNSQTVVSDLWSKFAEDRQGSGSAGWIFATDHPRLRKKIYETYLDGLDPFTWVRNRLRCLPAQHGLEIGCGGGDLAIAMIETGMCARLDAFDVASGAIDGARAKAAAKGIETINFFVTDGNAVKLPRKRYDFVYASHALHHIENLENLFEQVADALTPEGLFFADDYIGPSRMQYSDAHISLMNQLLLCLPPHKRRDRLAENIVKSRVDRVPIEVFMEIDPSEGVRAADIVPLMRKHFDVEVFPTGMSLLYQVLLGIIHNFDVDNPVDDALLDLIFVADSLCTKANLVDPCFACLVARPKPSLL